MRHECILLVYFIVADAVMLNFEKTETEQDEL